MLTPVLARTFVMVFMKKHAVVESQYMRCPTSVSSADFEEVGNPLYESPAKIYL